MMSTKIKVSLVSLFVLVLAAAISCRSTKEYHYIKKSIPAGSKIAVLLEADNDMENAVVIEFMKAGYKLSPVNASDFYTPGDVFDIKTIRKSAFISGVLNNKNPIGAMTLLDKMFKNMYELHLYNFENAKAKYLKQLQETYGIDYLILLSLKPWEGGYSWARAVDLREMDLVYVHNFQAGKKDDLQKMTARVIQVLSKGS